MKKIFLTRGIIISMFFQTQTFALSTIPGEQEGTETEDFYAAPCDALSQEDKRIIAAILAKVEKKQEIYMTYTTLFKPVVATRLQNFLQRTENTIHCNSYDTWNTFSSLTEFKKDLKATLLAIIHAKKWEKIFKSSGNTEKENQAILSLQTHFIENFLGQIDREDIKKIFSDPYAYGKSFHLFAKFDNSKKIVPDVPFTHITANVVLSQTGRMYLAEQQGDGSILFSGDITAILDCEELPSCTTPDETVSLGVGGNLDLFFKLTNQKIFIQVPAIAAWVQGDTTALGMQGDINKDIAQRINTFTETVGKKYITIPLDEQATGEKIPFLAQNLSGVLDGFMQQIFTYAKIPLVRFLAKSEDGTTAYGTINPAVCELIGMKNPFQQERCLEFIFDSLDKTEGKGFIALKDVGNETYRLGITDTFFSSEEILDSEEKYFIDNLFIQRNTEKVTSFVIPIPSSTKDAGIFYTSPHISVKYEEDPISFLAQGIVAKDSFSLTGTLLVASEESKGTFSLAIQKKEKGGYEGTMSVTGYKHETPVMIFSLQTNEEHAFIAPFTVAEPNEEETINSEMAFEKSFPEIDQR